MDNFRGVLPVDIAHINAHFPLKFVSSVSVAQVLADLQDVRAVAFNPAKEA
jgi:hypothetical protein